MTPRQDTSRKPDSLTRQAVLGCVTGVSLVLCIVLIRGWFHSSMEVASPKNSGYMQPIVFEPSSTNFGVVLQRETKAFVFLLANNTTNLVHIVGLRSSCDCTIVGQHMIGRIIPASGSITIPVYFHSRTDTGKGLSVVEALLQSANGARYYAQATVTGTIDGDFTYLPCGLDFGILRPGESVERAITFIPGAIPNVTLTDLRSTGGFIARFSSYGPVESVQSNAAVRVLVRFRAPFVKYSETFNGVITLATSSKRLSNVTISASATVIPNLEAVPDEIVLPRHCRGCSVNITINSRWPSKIICYSIVARNAMHSQRLTIINGWNVKHYVTLREQPLSLARGVEFSLALQSPNGTSRKEVRDVFVKVLHL